MDIFDDDKKAKTSKLPLGYTLDDIIEKLDLDLRRWIVFSGLSLDMNLVFEISTICCMLSSDREVRKNLKKYSETDIDLIDESNAALVEMMYNKKKKTLN